MEQAGLDFYERVIAGFDELSAQEDRFVVVEASTSISEISITIKSKVLQILSKKEKQQ